MITDKIQMEVKKIASFDQKISIHFNDIQNVCICYSMYPLLQYLLLFDEDVIKSHTCYFIGSGGIAQSVSNKLPAFYYDTKPTKSKQDKIIRIIQKICLRLLKKIKYPFIKKSTIYAQDFGYLSILIGSKQYSMLAEASNHLTIVGQKDSVEFQNSLQKTKSLKGRLQNILYGPLSTRIHGYNKQCMYFYCTEKNFAIALNGKKQIVNSFKELWDRSTEEKKKFILYVFDVTDDDVQMLSQKSTIFLTQPLVFDKLVSEQDYVSLLNEAFAHYDINDMVIKTHPRDTFNYKKHFPSITVFDKPISMQLLSLIGIKIKKAVTFASTAVDILPDEVQIDWFGIPTHKLLKKIDPINFPSNRPYNQMQWKI